MWTKLGASSSAATTSADSAAPRSRGASTAQPTSAHGTAIATIDHHAGRNCAVPRLATAATDAASAATATATATARRGRTSPSASAPYPAAAARPNAATSL